MNSSFLRNGIITIAYLFLNPFFLYGNGLTNPGQGDAPRVLLFILIGVTMSLTFLMQKGFVAQIVLKTFLPLPQTDSAYGFCLGYAKSGEAI